MLRVLLCAFALTFATPAFADPPEGEITAAPGSIAIGMIENAEAEGVFDIVHNGQVSVRHIGSGMRCDFERNGEGGRIVIFPQLRRGDNVACDQHDDRQAITIYATRYPQQTNLREQIEIADGAILQRFADATPYTIADPANASAPVPTTHVRYIVTWNDERSFTRASVAIIGDWTIKMRYSAYVADDAAARQAEETATQIFLQTLRDLEPPGNL
jgi:hypothetical protein